VPHLHLFQRKDFDTLNVSHRPIEIFGSIGCVNKENANVARGTESRNLVVTQRPSRFCRPCPFGLVQVLDNT
jgi:hypothetical protein